MSTKLKKKFGNISESKARFYFKIHVTHLNIQNVGKDDQKI
jgi:hypothetical protein